MQNKDAGNSSGQHPSIPSGRLQSLDVLRGFDMLFIMGFAGLVTSLCALAPGSWTDALSGLMKHADWHGLTHHDTIFPLFLFIAGVSFPYSLSKQRAANHSEIQISARIVRRGITLVLLGMVCNGFFKLNFEELRIASVLGRIGLAWMFAALIYMWFGRRTAIIAAITILVGYFLLLEFVPSPDAAAGSDPYAFESCLAGWVDRQWLPGYLLYKSLDPEGLLSTIPAIATALIGVLTGDFLRSEQLNPNRKAGVLLLAAVAITLIGLLWSIYMPINKILWTSSFVCVVGGYSLGMLALFYYLIDVRGWWRHTLFFRVIGLNSITIYMAQCIVSFWMISNFFVGGLVNWAPEIAKGAISHLGYVTVCWLFLYFLYRKKTFLKV